MRWSFWTPWCIKLSVFILYKDIHMYINVLCMCVYTQHTYVHVLCYASVFTHKLKYIILLWYTQQTGFSSLCMAYIISQQILNIWITSFNCWNVFMTITNRQIIGAFFVVLTNRTAMIIYHQIQVYLFSNRILDTFYYLLFCLRFWLFLLVNPYFTSYA